MIALLLMTAFYQPIYDGPVDTNSVEQCARRYIDNFCSFNFDRGYYCWKYVEYLRLDPDDVMVPRIFRNASGGIIRPSFDMVCNLYANFNGMTVLSTSKTVGRGSILEILTNGYHRASRGFQNGEDVFCDKFKKFLMQYDCEVRARYARCGTVCDAVRIVVFDEHRYNELINQINNMLKDAQDDSVNSVFISDVMGAARLLFLDIFGAVMIQPKWSPKTTQEWYSVEKKLFNRKLNVKLYNNRMGDSVLVIGEECCYCGLA